MAADPLSTDVRQKVYFFKLYKLNFAHCCTVKFSVSMEMSNLISYCLGYSRESVY